MERLPSETESKIGTLFATLVGFALIDGFTALRAERDWQLVYVSRSDSGDECGFFTTV